MWNGWSSSEVFSNVHSSTVPSRAATGIAIGSNCSR